LTKTGEEPKFAVKRIDDEMTKTMAAWSAARSGGGDDDALALLGWWVVG